jgi:DNA repair exonuclease SbcCD ATPase subunit/DNA repair exonuclease SbcCD nuclease subunit
MDIKHYDIGLKWIDKIYHVSDVHIRTLKRHREYREVFRNLFDHIAQHATDNSIAVVTGDIVHSKLDMSPELIEILVEFFEGFMIPTIVILGNHDMNLNNMHRTDAVSPILNVIKNPNIIFVRENGLFEIANVVFNHMAVDVSPSEYIRANQFEAAYKIALHHGAVNTAKTDIGYQISNEHVGVDLFDGHDIVLLGDIHKPAQFLNEARSIAYPGSLIQQNHGEALDHGILVWELPDRTAKFEQIHNDYGYVTIEVQGTQVINAPHRIPAKPRVRIKFQDTSAADMKKLIATIRKKYDVQDITIQRTTASTNNEVSNSYTIGNVRDVEYQNTLITDYISVNFPQATAEETDAVRHINRTINSKLPAVESIRHVTWHPVSFEFDNMFSYGEGNVINFENLQDVCGLFAANTSGKSSLLDAITYTIFDKCSKTGKANEVLNNKKTWFRGTFRFEMNGVIYTIERRGTKNKKKETHVKVDVDFYTESENLNGEERSDTNKSIRRYLGTYDDFILTAFSLQADNNNFIEKSQKERKDLLSQFLDITVFEQLYQLASDEIKETAGKLKEYKKTDFAKIILDADLIITQNQQSIEDFQNLENEAQDRRNTYQNDIVTLIETKLPTTYTGPKIEILEQQETDLTDSIETLQTQIETAEQEIHELKQNILENKNKIKTQYNLTELQQGITKLKTLEKKFEELRQSIKLQKGVVNAKQEKINHLAEHEYDPNCKYCTSNVFVQNAIEAQNTINQDRTVLDELIQQYEDVQNSIEDLIGYETQYNEYVALKQKIDTCNNNLDVKELQLQILESDLQTRESELETSLERQESFKSNETAIKHNDVIDLQIVELKSKIETENDNIKSITDSIRSKHGKIEVAKTTKSTAITQLDAYKQLETEYKAFEYYLDSVKRDGVPYELISKAMPKIESEINNVLNQVVDFNMVLQSDGKNINGYIIYDEDNFWPLELTSGMERFISSLAIRIALINVSALPRPNFIAIDEGWGSLDAEHVSAVVNLFDYFRNKFDFSIIISHVDTMRDMVDSLIEVNKISGYSCIQHT